MKNERLPKHVVAEYGTARNWIRLKRKQMKILQNSMKDMRMGSAFLPEDAYRAIVDAGYKIDQAHSACKDWWSKV